MQAFAALLGKLINAKTVYLNIETERLLLRPIRLKDANFILDLVNTESWLKFIGNRNVSNINEAEDYIQKILHTPNYYYQVFELKTTQKAIGIVTFLKRDDEDFPDIGFALLPQYEKNGYAFEASKSYLGAIDKSNQYETIIAITMPENKKSIHLLRKLGLEYQYDRNKGKEVLSYYIRSKQSARN